LKAAMVASVVCLSIFDLLMALVTSSPIATICLTQEAHSPLRAYSRSR
jgi:hypothetical protein